MTTTWWVATTGNDGAAGTSSAHPFLTIHKASTQAQPGDTINVLPGTYTDTLLPPGDSAHIIQANGSSTASSGNNSSTPLAANAVYTGAAESTSTYTHIFVEVTSDQSSAIDGWQILQSDDQVNWTVSIKHTLLATFTDHIYMTVTKAYFKVRYTNGSQAQSSFSLVTNKHKRILYQSTDANGVYSQWTAHVRSGGATATWFNSGYYSDIVGFDISVTPGDTYGYYGLAQEGNYQRAMRNRVHDIPAPICTDNGAAGIYGHLATHHNDILGNLVFNVGQILSCLNFHGIYAAAPYSVVANNICYNNDWWGIHMWHAANQMIVTNNLCFGNGYGGITVGAGDAGATINDYTLVANNICINAGHYGIDEFGEHVGTHNQYLNNCCYNNSFAEIAVLNNNLVQATVVADPKFVNFKADGSGDYHLSAASPCINAGQLGCIRQIDYDGVGRPFGAQVDIGPYEYAVYNAILRARNGAVVLKVREM